MYNVKIHYANNPDLEFQDFEVVHITNTSQVDEWFGAGGDVYETKAAKTLVVNLSYARAVEVALAGGFDPPTKSRRKFSDF